MWNWVKNLYDVRATESDSRSTKSDESPSILQLRANFENREAIYLEKGVLRVRVTDIRAWAVRRVVWANVEEVPAPGLGVGLFDNRKHKEPTPLHWRIRAGYLTEFSDHCWVMGYGGWSLYFDPKVVQGVLALASRFPVDVDTHERYKRIVQFVQQPSTVLGVNWQKVFPEA